jgi:hypothetical protein
MSFVDLEKAFVSLTREVLNNIFIEFCIPAKLVRLINLRLIETYDKARIDKNLFDAFPVHNDLKKMFYHHWFSALL